MTEALSHLKYIVFFATLFIGVPAGYLLGKKYPKVERVIFFLLIFFTARMEISILSPARPSDSVLADLRWE